MDVLKKYDLLAAEAAAKATPMALALYDAWHRGLAREIPRTHTSYETWERIANVARALCANEGCKLPIGDRRETAQQVDKILGIDSGPRPTPVGIAGSYRKR